MWAETANVDMFDSLPSMVSSRTEDQIADICMSEEKEITLNIKNVQTQNGGDDCGLFALASATSLCFGEDPSNIAYTQHKMRNHLQQCFVNRCITLFPQRLRKRQYQRPSIIKTQELNIYCYCRQPKSGRMIQCNICEEWFHIRFAQMLHKQFGRKSPCHGTVEIVSAAVSCCIIDYLLL